MEARSKKNVNEAPAGSKKGQKQAAGQTDIAAEGIKSKSKVHKANNAEEELRKLQAEKTQMEEELITYRQKMDELEVKLEESNDKFIRLFSEFDNYRKRTGRERQELIKTAGGELIEALLPVLDDLQRASSLTSANQNDINVQTGINLIYQKFKNILKQKGVEEIPAEGQAFDTDYHEAVTHIPADNEEQKGMVVEELLKGYILHGKVIRYSRVVVAN